MPPLNTITLNGAWPLPAERPDDNRWHARSGCRLTSWSVTEPERNADRWMLAAWECSCGHPSMLAIPRERALLTTVLGSWIHYVTGLVTEPQWPEIEAAAVLRRGVDEEWTAERWAGWINGQTLSLWQNGQRVEVAIEIAAGRLRTVRATRHGAGQT